MAMRVVERAADLHALLASPEHAGQRVGFVPTMGNLHAGHHSLIGIARARTECVVASVFVNPTQFGPNEDFARYPRTPDADIAGLAAHGCDVVFMPPIEDMYPHGVARTARMIVPAFGDILEGAVRPGHFDGVATVVAKLFNLVRPDVAVFGQKDYQQLLLVRYMARDMGYPIEIVGAPIVREANGLAMSSRNQYLSAQQRECAGVIHATLSWMRERVHAGERAFDAIEAQAHARLQQAGLVPDYAVIRRAADLAEPAGNDSSLVGLVAARLGSTRLIDNMLMDERIGGDG